MDVPGEVHSREEAKQKKKSQDKFSCFDTYNIQVEDVELQSLGNAEFGGRST